MLSRLYCRWSQAVDIVCYLLIMAGISVDAVYLPASPKKIDVRATRPAHLPSAWLSTHALDTRTRATGSCTWSQELSWVCVSGARPQPTLPRACGHHFLDGPTYGLDEHARYRRLRPILPSLHLDSSFSLAVSRQQIRSSIMV